MYDLTHEKYRKVLKIMEEKSRACSMQSILQVQTANGMMNLILNASDVRETEMVAARDLTWASLPATIDINYLIHQNDMRIKASTLGSFLESMLNAKAKDKLLHMKTLLMVMSTLMVLHIGGVSQLWFNHTMIIQSISFRIS